MVPTGGVEQQTVQSGFVVVIEGYSPYQNIAHLMDPPGVGTDQNRWGVVTRFENLSQLFPDIPFELYGKGDIRNFDEKWDWVDPSDTMMPVGIGIPKEVERIPSDESGVPGGGPGITMTMPISVFLQD